MISPWIYAIIPASDSSICLCHFLKEPRTLTGFGHVTHIDEQWEFYLIQAVNIGMFYLSNCLFLFALIFMGFRIRHIKDNLSLTTELATVVIIWIIFSSMQFTFYLLQQIQSCEKEKNKPISYA
jgi:hypothetical protein